MIKSFAKSSFAPHGPLFANGPSPAAQRSSAQVIAVSQRSFAAMRPFSASVLRRRFNSSSDHPAGITHENRLAPVAPVHHVVNRALIFNSKLSRHGPELWQNQQNTSIFTSDPFSTDL
jgi:hypothetical protein